METNHRKNKTTTKHVIKQKKFIKKYQNKHISKISIKASCCKNFTIYIRFSNIIEH